MPVKKYRTLEQMNADHSHEWLAPGDPESAEARVEDVEALHGGES